MVVSEIRKYTEAAAGKLSPQKAQELAKSLMQGKGKDQVTKAAHDLMTWSNKNRERLAQLVRSEVRTQLKQMGVASRDEVDALRKRVRELEKAQGGRKTTAKRSTAKRSTAKRSTAKRASAGSTASPAPATTAEAAAPATGTDAPATS
jgi:polyhydroxyalkanoate synthesis regulator phasin